MPIAVSILLTTLGHMALKLWTEPMIEWLVLLGAQQLAKRSGSQAAQDAVAKIREALDGRRQG